MNKISFCLLTPLGFTSTQSGEDEIRLTTARNPGKDADTTVGSAVSESTVALDVGMEPQEVQFSVPG